MQIIQSIILVVVTTIVTNFFTRKFYISDKDRIIKEKQFKIYEGLYINIVKNRVNEPILPCLAKKNHGSRKNIKQINRHTHHTSETVFSSAGLNLYCCIFSPFS